MWSRITLDFSLLIGLLAVLPAEAEEPAAPAKAEAPLAVERPESIYAFKESPADALEVLKHLKSSWLDVRITPAEASLFDDARDGKLDEHSFAEAVLLASGELKDQKRQAYLKRIDELESEARRVTAGAKTTFEVGERLLAWLHEGPLSGGYEARQTDVTKILDEKRFNCVSSAALYNVLGRRLGLDLRAIEVPDHAFSILYEGERRADVETTCALGFNPARDPKVAEELSQTTGFHYISEHHADQRREVGDIGLAAIIYYNHGVGLLEEKRYPEALLANFRALSLDPKCASAVKNVLAGLSKWSCELADADEFEQSLEVLAMGLRLAPKDGTLLNNRTAVWEAWATAEMKVGRIDEALEVVHRAAKQVTSEADHFISLESWLFIGPGEERANAGEWKAALKTVEPGIQKLTDKPRDVLLEWRNGIYLRWSNFELEKKEFANAAAALEEGLTVAPKDNRFENNFQYVMQEWLRHVSASQTAEVATQAIDALRTRFAKLPGADDVVFRHVHNLVLQERDAGTYEEALATIDRFRELLISLKHEKEGEELAANVYTTWAGALAKADDRQAALKVYESAFARLPKNSEVENGLAYSLQEWLKQAHADEGEAAAMALLTDVLNRFESSGEVRDVAVNHVGRVVQALRQDAKFKEALAAVGRHAELLRKLDKPKEIEDLSVSVYDAWADTFMNARDWAKAIDVYEKGLKQFPDSGHLTNNLAYCKQEQKTEEPKKGQAKKE